MTKKKHSPFYLNLFLMLTFALNSTNVSSQLIDIQSLDTIPELTYVQALKQDPLNVYKLTFRKQKLTELPDITQFKNLQSLNISRNKLSSLPKQIFEFQYLQNLDVSDNPISTIPVEIGNLVYLRKFIANETNITGLPAEISKLKVLNYLDVWGTNVASFPDEIADLKETLKEIDMRVIMMNNSEHQKIKTLLPQTKIHFSKSCNCGF